MITILRSASIAPGKVGDAMAFAHKIAAFISENYAVKLELLMPVGGNPNRIAWRADYSNVAEWEILSGKLMADQGYLAIVAANSATFLPGSVHDDIWRTI